MDANAAEHFVLHDGNCPHFDELKQGQKSNNDVGPGRCLLKKCLKIHGGLRKNLPANRFDFLTDTDGSDDHVFRDRNEGFQTLENDPKDSAEVVRNDTLRGTKGPF